MVMVGRSVSHMNGVIILVICDTDGGPGHDKSHIGMLTGSVSCLLLSFRSCKQI